MGILMYFLQSHPPLQHPCSALMISPRRISTLSRYLLGARACMYPKTGPYRNPWEILKSMKTELFINTGCPGNFNRFWVVSSTTRELRSMFSSYLVVGSSCLPFAITSNLQLSLSLESTRRHRKYLSPTDDL